MCWQSAKPSDPEPVEEGYFAEYRMAVAQDGSNLTWSAYDNYTAPLPAGPRCNPPAQVCLPTSVYSRGYCVNGICCSDTTSTFCVCEYGYRGRRCSESIVQASSAFAMGSGGMIAIIVFVVAVIVLVVAVVVVCHYRRRRSSRFSRQGSTCYNGEHTADTPLTETTPASEKPAQINPETDRLKDV